MGLKWKIETICSEKVEAECSDLIRKTCPTTPIFLSKQNFVKGHTFLQTILFLSCRAAEKHTGGHPLPVTSPSVVAPWAWTCQSISRENIGHPTLLRSSAPNPGHFVQAFTWLISRFDPSLPSREPSALLLLGLRSAPSAVPASPTGSL